MSPAIVKLIKPSKMIHKPSAAHSMEWYLFPDYDLNVDIFSQDGKGSSP